MALIQYEWYSGRQRRSGHRHREKLTDDAGRRQACTS